MYDAELPEEAKREELQAVYGGYIARWAAFFIDVIAIRIIFVLILLLSRVILGLYNLSDLLFATTFFVVAILYFAIFESSSWQGTIGKRLYKIKVITKDNSTLTFKQSLIRATLKTCLAGSLIGSVECLLAFRSPSRQTLHDKIAKTFVVKRNR